MQGLSAGIMQKSSWQGPPAGIMRKSSWKEPPAGIMHKSSRQGLPVGIIHFKKFLVLQITFCQKPKTFLVNQNQYFCLLNPSYKRRYKRDEFILLYNLIFFSSLQLFTSLSEM
jgi:hypothetical protein